MLVAIINKWFRQCSIPTNLIFGQFLFVKTNKIVYIQGHKINLKIEQGIL